jgi:hypothetical protein
MVQVNCPKCQASLRFADAERGSVVACTKCGKRLRLPSTATVKQGAKPTPQDNRAIRKARRPAEVAPRAEVEEDPSADVEESDLADESPDKAQKGRKLGPAIATFVGSSGHLAMQVFGLSLLLLFGLFLLILAIGAFVGGPGVSLGERVLIGLLLTPLGLGVIGLTVWLFRRQLQEWKQRVLLSTNGFAIIRGNRKTVYVWDDILTQYQKITDHYVNDVHTGTTHVYTMECADGGKLVFKDSLKNVKRLGEAIADEIMRRELPRALEDYDAGRVVNFGKLSVSKKGLTYGDSFLPWKEVQGVQIADGYISVSKKGKWLNWCSIGAPSVPNLFVFLALVDEIVGVKGL